MSNTNHPWSRDPVAQAAVRAVEDDAATWRRLEVGEVIDKDDQYLIEGVWRYVPSLSVGGTVEERWFPVRRRRVPPPDHRDMPAAVADLRERVGRLEGERRPATWQEEEAAVEGAWSLCGLEPDWPNDEPGTIVRHAESMRREIGRLRARVAELESAAKLAPGANAGGEANPLHATAETLTESEQTGGAAKQEPVAWGVMIDSGRGLYGHYDFESEARGVCDAVNAEEGWSMTVVPLYAAPVAESATTPQPPRGWLTDGERRAIEEGAYALVNDGYYGARAKAELLRALLARSSPPMVKVPNLLQKNTWQSRDSQWIAAIREAGWEVG